MEAIEFLKSVKNYSKVLKDISIESFAGVIEEYVDLVCHTKAKVLKQGIHQMFRTDVALKSMTAIENERVYFVGKEFAFRQIIKLVEDIENTELNELLVKTNHRLGVK